MRLGFRSKLTLAITLVVALAVLFSLTVTQRKIADIYLRSQADRSELGVSLAQAEQEAVTRTLRTSAWNVTNNNVRLIAALADPVEANRNYGQLYRDLEVEFIHLREAAEALATGNDPPELPGGRFRYVKPDGPDAERLVPPPAKVNAGDFPADPVFHRNLLTLLSSPEKSPERSAHLAVGNQPWWVLALPVRDPNSETLLGWIVLATPEATPRPRQPGELPALRTGNAWAATDGFDPELRRQVGQTLDSANAYRTVKGVEIGEQWRLYAQPMRVPGLATSWRVLLFSTAGLKEDLSAARTLILALGGGLMLGAGCLAWLLAHNLSLPLIRLRDATRAVEKGDFTVRVVNAQRDELGQLSESFNQMASELALKEKYKSVLDRVTDPEVARRLVHGEISLGGELRRASVLFCDIRGFTALTEGMNPADVITMLNEHMTALTAIANRHHGVVDKFSGDEIMVLFGAPESYGNDALNAARCALDMVAERIRLNHSSYRHISVGIGIATGELVAGCMGSVDRLNYTVLGARVNLAARLCGKAGRMEILVDEATGRELPPEIPAEAMPEMSLKGFTLAHAVFRLGTRK